MLEESRSTLERWGKQDAEPAMHNNAVWTDRTGEARARLDVTFHHPPNLYDGGTAVLAHHARHGFYLDVKRGHRDPLDVPTMAEVFAVGGAVAELSNGSQWAIVQPTVATQGPQLLQYMREIWQ